MSKTVFDHLTEQLDQVVKGRRYIISEIGKLKESVEQLRDIVNQSSGGGSDMGMLVNDLKTFMQRTIGTLGELKNTVTQLGGLVKNLSGQVQQLQTTGVRSGAPAAAASSMSSAPSYSSSPMPAMSSPSPSPAMGSMPPAPAAAAGGAPGAAGASFDRILQSAQSGTPAKDLGGMIDALRTALSKANPLNPILFELSMEAGRLKSLGANALDESNISSLQQKINKWKSKS